MSDVQHNLNTFRQMSTFWFPQRKPRGKTYRFSERQLAIAIRVQAQKESK